MGTLIDPKLGLKLGLGLDSGITETARHNRQMVVDAYKAQLAGDLNAIGRLMHPKVKFYEAESLPFGWASEGVEGVAVGIGRFFSFWSEITAEFEEVTAAGDLVINYFKLRGKSSKTGEVYERPGCELFRFEEGKIIEFRVFHWDTHEVRLICGVE